MIIGKRNSVGTDIGNFIGTPAILVDQRSSGGSSLAQFQADCSPSCGTSTLPLVMAQSPLIHHGGLEQIVLSLPVACSSSCGGGEIFVDDAGYAGTGINDGGSIIFPLGNSFAAGVHTFRWNYNGVDSLTSSFTVDATEANYVAPNLTIAPSSIAVGQDVTATENPGYTDTLGYAYGALDGNPIVTSGGTYGYFYSTRTTSFDLGSSLSIGTHTFTYYYSGTSDYKSSIGNINFVVTGPTATPTFSPSPGTYSTTQTVTISDATPSSNIYYTTDGSTPTTSSTLYTGPISVSASETIKALAASTATGYMASSVGPAAYTISQQAAAPTFSPVAGTYGTTQTVTISDTAPSHTIYYTTDGSTPTTSSAVYTSPITVSATETLQALAVSSNPAYTQSSVGSAAYTISSTAPPTFSPSGGTYGSAQTVTILEANPAATIYYTTDGSTPTISSLIYTAPITVSSTQMVRAIARAVGESPSAPGSATYNLPSANLYSYCIADTADCTSSTLTSGYTANGNITAYNDSINGRWSMGYDSLNRLVSAQPTTGPFSGNNSCWAYDSFGNIIGHGIQTTSCPAVGSSIPSTWNQLAVATNNRMTGDSVGTTYSYDDAGNMLNVLGDIPPTGGTAIQSLALYDGEGRLCATRESLGSGMYRQTQYIYDAEGNRVAKRIISDTITDWNNNGCDITLAATQETTYLIGPNGEQMTEFDVTANAWAHVNVYAAGQLAATYSNESRAPAQTPVAAPLYFDLADWLGSKRVQITGDGTVYGSWSNLPFGDGQQCVTCTADATEQHFTGKERDAESGLDYFGARYYGSNMGRFMSPDPSGLYYADQTNPQSLNLYSYVLNNPLKFTDPTGMYCDYSDHNDAASIADDSQQDYHSSQGECTAKDENGNRGVWVNDAATHLDANGQGVDNDGRPDSAISSNTTSNSTPLSGDFSFNMTKAQFVDMMSQANISLSPMDDRMYKYTHFGHKGTNLRGNNSWCSIHATIDTGAGENGKPVTGNFHIDEFQPFKSSNLTGGPDDGGNIPNMPMHAVRDVIPDLLIKAGVTSWTGNQNCPTTP